MESSKHSRHKIYNHLYSKITHNNTDIVMIWLVSSSDDLISGTSRLSPTPTSLQIKVSAMDVRVYLSITLLSCCAVTLNAICSKEGELKTEAEWYDDILSANYPVGAVIDFQYSVTYSTRDSEENPIELIMYLQDTTSVSVLSHYTLFIQLYTPNVTQCYSYEWKWGYYKPSFPKCFTDLQFTNKCYQVPAISNTPPFHLHRVY